MNQPSKALLLVEGAEAIWIPTLCKVANFSPSIDIEPQNGISELKTSFKTYLKTSQNYRNLGIIIDADVDFSKSWQSIRDIIIRSNKYGINYKYNLEPNGSRIVPLNNADMNIFVWIMPNNIDNGMFEDFLLKMIVGKDLLLDRAKDIVNDLDRNRVNYSNLFKHVHLSKALLHTWLSWHDSPDDSVNVAIQKKIFNTKENVFLEFIKWMNDLANV